MTPTVEAIKKALVAIKAGLLRRCAPRNDELEVFGGCLKRLVLVFQYYTFETDTALVQPGVREYRIRNPHSPVRRRQGGELEIFGGCLAFGAVDRVSIGDTEQILIF